MAEPITLPKGVQILGPGSEPGRVIAAIPGRTHYMDEDEADALPRDRSRAPATHDDGASPSRQQ